MALFDLLSNARTIPQKLEDAITTHDLTELRKLLEDGIDPNIKLHKFGGDRAIHLAASRGDVQIIKQLINAGCVCDQPNDSNITPIYNAFRANKCEAFKELLKYCGIDKHLNYLWIEGLYVESKISEDYAIQTVQIISASNLLLQAHHQHPTFWDVFFTMNLSNLTDQFFPTCENIKLLFLTGFKTPDSAFLIYEKKVVEKFQNLSNIDQLSDLSEAEQVVVEDKAEEILDILSFMKKNPLSLKHLCRLAIRCSFWNKCNVFYGVHRIPLPTQLKKYILFEE